uniref:Uncharacterized protein n=1 Tax=Arundo donax TaxID=35708 RepID=A0A0A9FEJ2_ARUDO
MLVSYHSLILTISDISDSFGTILNIFCLVDVWRNCITQFHRMLNLGCVKIQVARHI